MKNAIVAYRIPVCILLAFIILLIVIFRYMYVKKINIGGISHTKIALIKEFEFGEEGYAPGEFHNPDNITIDSHNNVYTSEYNGGRIQKFASDGTVISMWNSPTIRPDKVALLSGMVVDNAGYVYLLDWSQKVIHKYSSNGKYIMNWGSIGINGGKLLHPYFQKNRDEFDATKMINPTGIAIDKAGNIYVLDKFRQCIFIYSDIGNLLEIISLSEKINKYAMPDCIAIDKNNHIIICDILLNSLYVLDRTGKVLFDWDIPIKLYPKIVIRYRILIDTNNRIYIATYNREMFVFSNTGHIISKFDNIINSNEHVEGIAINSKNEIYISEFKTNKIIKYRALY